MRANFHQLQRLQDSVLSTKFCNLLKKAVKFEGEYVIMVKMAGVYVYWVGVNKTNEEKFP